MKTPPKTKKPARKTAASAKKAPRKAVHKKAPRKAPPKKAKSKAAPKKAAARPPASAPNPMAELTALAVAALEDLKGLDIKVLDVRDLTAITDTMVICTGTSNRHVRSLAESVMDRAKAKGLRPHGVEGLAEGEWVLVDLNGVVVHVMQVQARVFYQAREALGYE